MHKHTLQQRLRDEILDPKLAEHYNMWANKPGCSVSGFCGRCKGGLQEAEKLFCSNCDYILFNHTHRNTMLRKEMASLDNMGNGYIPVEFRKEFFMAQQAAALLRGEITSHLKYPEDEYGKETRADS